MTPAALHPDAPALDLPLPASLDDAHLVPWLVALIYGDTDVLDSPFGGPVREYVTNECAPRFREAVEKFGGAK